ncbi:MAG TPA: PAS domain-containing protein, partial [Candidatus Cloacimonadota bacterium]|nr:PAS domain-containing protein [Candidatus Cloacimonadota bacterium]
MLDWVEHIPIAISVCDKEGIIIQINATAAETFAKYGGKELIGKSIFDYHPEHCNAMIRKMLATGESHSYTISKAGKKKLIHQQPYLV